MELDAILRAGEEDEEEYYEESAVEEPEALFFMEPDHEEVRMNEDPEVQDYWETGLMTETISALKTGNVDHSQKSSYHCSRKGPIKANCPEKKKTGSLAMDKEAKALREEDHCTKRIRKQKRTWEKIHKQKRHY